LRAANVFICAPKQTPKSPKRRKIAKRGNRQKDDTNGDAHGRQVERWRLRGDARRRKDAARERKSPSGAISCLPKAKKGGKRAGRWSASVSRVRIKIFLKQSRRP
jgi:hypothetical protein